MSEDDRKILVDNHSILLSDMFDVTIIDGYLRRARILSAPALEYILSTNTRYKRVRRLLIVLPFCGSRALEEFKEARHTWHRRLMTNQVILVHVGSYPVNTMRIHI